MHFPTPASLFFILGAGVFDLHTILPFVSALYFAAYGDLIGHAARRKSTETSFFWMVVGVVLIGPFFCLPPAGPDWLWMGVLCLTRISGYFLLIKTYDVTEAPTVQPFAYFQLVFKSAVGVWAFGNVIDRHIVLGASIIEGWTL